MKNKAVLLRVIVAALAIAVVALLAIVLWPKPSTDIPESVGVSGIISDEWDSGIDHGSVETAGAQVPGYSMAKMNAGDTSLHLNIGNPKENDVGFYVTVELEDGTVLYTSPLLEPGQGISDLPLASSPEKGTYNAFAVYQLVSLDESHTPMNTVRSSFTLYVE